MTYRGKVGAEEDGEVKTSNLNGKDWPRVHVTVRGKRHYLCEKCGTWVCDRCGHKRERANRKYRGIHSCAKCGSRQGTWKVIYHSMMVWARHYGHVPTKDWTGGA